MGGEILVLGIVGMLTWLIPFGGLPIPIIGLIWGVLILRRKPANKWLAVSGVALCSIGLFLSAFYSVISVIGPVTTTTTSLPPVTNGASYVPPEETGPAVWTADGVIKGGEYTNKISLGVDYELYWKSDGQYIYIAMKAKTSGWVAVGIQPGSMMKDADMMFGFVKDGKTMVSDTFSTGSYGPHPPDTDLGGKNNILEFGGREEGGYTIIEFKRALTTGDKYDHPLSKGVNKIIWAYGSDDELTPKHIVRGYGEIDL